MRLFFARWRALPPLAALLLASCGDKSLPANTQVSGVVKSASWVRPSCYKIEMLLGGCGRSYYAINVVSDASESWSGSIGDLRIDEDDIRRVIGERVTFGCYRAHDSRSPRCNQQWSNLV